MNFLNIDELASTTRQIKIGGTIHIVQEQSVQQFIDAIKAAEELEKEAAEGKVTPVGSLEHAVKSICRALPTLPEAQVRGMTLPVLTAILNFIRGEMPAGAGQAPEQGDSGEKKPL